MNNSYKEFLFTVIMPIYNTEKYLEEAIDSIVMQTIGFENIQMVLVNDGSTDNSEAICRKYEKRYPVNILYISKENGGLCSARNAGIKHIKGEYVNFFDSDDKWDKNAFKAAQEQFLKYGDQIDVVSGRIKYFERAEGYGARDYKYSSDRLLKILSAYRYVQLSATSAFIRYQAAKEVLFDERLTPGEDVLYMTRIILKKEQYVVARSAIYNYRLRKDNNSITNGISHNKYWMMTGFRVYEQEMKACSIEKYEKVIPYVNYALLLAFHQLMRSVIPDGVMTAKEMKEYETYLKNFIKDMDDKLIMCQTDVPLLRRIFALNYKYGRNILNDIAVKGHKIMFDRLELYDISSAGRCRINIFEICGDRIHLEGMSDTNVLGEDFRLCIETSEKKYIPATFYSLPVFDVKSFNGETLMETKAFKFDMHVDDCRRFKMVLKHKSGKVFHLNPTYGLYAKFSTALKNSYYVSGNHLAKLKNNEIRIYRNRIKTHIVSELRVLRELFTRKEYRMMSYRMKYYLRQLLPHRDIAVTSSLTEADVSCNRAFKQCLGNRRLKILPESDMTNRKYQITYLLAAKSIHFKVLDGLTNPFGAKRVFISDLLQMDNALIIKSFSELDSVKWFNKVCRNYKEIYCFSDSDKKAILNGQHGYEKEVVLEIQYMV